MRTVIKVKSMNLYLQPSVNTLNMVVMETRQHPQLLAIGVVTETDVTPANQAAYVRQTDVLKRASDKEE